MEMDKLEEAYTEWRGRQDGTREPRGYTAHSGKWWPYSDPGREGHDEWKDCCHSVDAPTTKIPHTLWDHCKTLEHVAALYGLGLNEIAQLYRRYRDQEEKKWGWF
jgi:hypothetical protein